VKEKTRRLSRRTMARTAGSALLALSMALAATSGLAEKGGKGGGGGKPGGGGGDPEPAPDAAIVCMGRGMWKVNADGSNLTRILSRVPGWDPEPAWSHDAGHVVVNAAFGEVGIYRLEANGSNVTMIAGLTSGYVAGPDWSPVPTLDGSYRVVFEDDGLNGPPGSGNRDLFLVSIRQRGPRTRRASPARPTAATSSSSTSATTPRLGHSWRFRLARAW
jgi:hypothetical protein